ncbi:MAG TPA: hypothetical protein VEM40_00730 [Nitrospirota bacterium]|nr:hypothetical protein [Nitrospirota bacterium]
MENKDKPLPKPPNRVSGGKKQFGQEDEWGSLLADRMAAAMAEGKLDDFLKEELSDNEYARNLATMMMGMTGMLPAGGGPSSSTAPVLEEEASSAGAGTRDSMSTADTMPADVRKAIEGGDVKGLMELLRREHQKRMPGPEPAAEEKAAGPRPADHPTIDKNVIDALIRIASENSVTTDWIVLRAIKFYVQEYQKTGRL